MAAVTIDVDWWYELDYPDGSTCYGCGDGCWLAMWRLCMSINGKRQDWYGNPTCLCDSCHQIFMEKHDD